MLCVHTLGRFDVALDGTSLSWVHRQKRRSALLVYLAVEGATHRDRLMGVFWPDSAPDRARRALNQAVYALRRRLGDDALVVEDDTVALGGEVWTDVVAFEAACDRDDTAEAISLYAGPFLAGARLGDSAEFERWVEGQSAVLQRRHRVLRRREIEACIERGDLAAGLASARAWVDLEPAEDEAQHRLIELLAATGERSEALRRYEAYVEQLERDGLSPLEETEALAASLRAGEAGPVPGPVVVLAGSRPGQDTADRAAVPGPSGGPRPGTRPVAPASGASGDRSGSARVAAPARSRLRWLAPALAILVLAVGIGGFNYLHGRAATGPASDPVTGLAVLPFVVNGPDLQHLQGSGMVVLLSPNFDIAGSLRAINYRTVLARWDERIGDGPRPDLERMLDVASATGARYALTGSATETTGGVRLSGYVYDIETGQKLDQVQADGAADSLFSLVDRFSVEILTSIFGKGDVAARQPGLADFGTNSLEGIKAYLQGRALERQSHFEEASIQYQRAIDLDADFTLAWSSLLNVAWWTFTPADSLQWILSRIDSAWTRRSPREEASFRLQAALARNDPSEIAFGRETARQFPDDPEILFLYADLLWHEGRQVFLPLEDAVEYFDRAIALDPGFSPAYLHRIHYDTRTADVEDLERILPDYARATQAGRQAGPTELTLLSDALRDPEAAMGPLEEFLDTASLTAIITGPSHRLGFWNGTTALPAWTPPVVLRTAGVIQGILLRRGVDGGEAAPAQQRRIIAANALFALQRGQLRKARQLFDQRFPAAAFLLYRRMPAVPLPVSSGDVDALLTPMPPGDTALPMMLRLARDMAAGARAARAEEWAEMDGAVQALRDEAALAREAGDTAGNRFALMHEKALLAFARTLRGNVQTGTDTLEAMLLRPGAGPRVFEYPPQVRPMVRWWLGEIAERNGRYEDALRYWGTFAGEPLGQLVLGRVHERLGYRDAALTAYRRAADYWADADPDFTPADEARSGLARLSATTR